MPTFQELEQRHRKVTTPVNYGRQEFRFEYLPAVNNVGRKSYVENEMAYLKVSYGTPQGEQTWLSVDVSVERLYETGRVAKASECVTLRGRAEIEALRDYLNSVLAEAV